MAAPTWTEDMTDIYIGGAGNFSALGGGQSGLNTETDYFIQGTDCKSKNAWTNAIKGLIHNNGSSFTVPTTGAIIAWLYYAAVNALEDRAGVSPNFNGGLMFIEGSASNAYNRYNVAGADTLALSSWVPYVVDPNTATPDDTVGSPSGTEQWVGVEANLPTSSGPTKGAPIAIDAIRYGRCTLEYKGGDVGNGYNTFSGAEGTGNSVTNRWGLIEAVPGATSQYYVQGFHSLGTSSTAVDFRDSNVTLLIRDTPYVSVGFNRFEIIHTSTNVDWDNILIQSLGTQSPGTFVHTTGSWDCTNCQFIDVGNFTLLSTDSFTNCIFRGCGSVTSPRANLSSSQFIGYSGSANTSAVIISGSGIVFSQLSDTSYEMGSNNTHALEFSTVSSTTIHLNNCTFTGYNTTTNDQDNSTFHIKRTSGTVTILISGTEGTPVTDLTYRTDGADVVIVAPTVNTKVIVTNEIGQVYPGARVILKASDGTGDLPFEDSVTITRSGDTATVSHTAHGLSNSDRVEISGANEYQYNGAKTITVVNDNSYTFTIDSPLPISPATGTITSTGIILQGTTNISGEINDNRSYTVNQPVTGVVRKATNSPYYKDAPLNGIINKDSGLTFNIKLVLDE